MMNKALISILFLFFSSLVQADSASIRDARVWAAPDNTRVVFDIDAPVNHKLFTLAKPDRIVIDLENTQLKKAIQDSSFQKGIIKRIRTGQRKKQDLRVVLDLAEAVKVKSFLLKPTKNYGHRLVIDLYKKEAEKSRAVKSVTSTNGARDLVIAIDAGHGGEDPGATGYRGTQEKDVVMAIARKLQVLIEKEKGLRPLMIRNGDYYIGLRNRLNLARKFKADMFISIHADAFHNKYAKGASVYVLSQKGASTEAARWLAESENAADHIGGVSLEDKDDVLASVLFDLSMNGTIEASLELGNYVLSNLRDVGKVHKGRVEQAGFAVLKSPDIPSILVETAFISNPDEEKKLLNPVHQERVARSILKGVKIYFTKNTVPGTLLAQQKQQQQARKHVISRGDTLSAIAEQYNVSLQRLRSHNALREDHLQIGQVIVIPGG